MPTLDALFTERAKIGQLESIFFRRGEVEPVGKLVTLKRFKTLAKAELVRRAKRAKAAKRKRRRRKVSTPKKQTTRSSQIETPAPDGSIFWKIAAGLCEVPVQTLGTWMREKYISAIIARRFDGTQERDLRFIQLADVEQLCVLQNAGKFKVDGHTIDGKLFLYVAAAAERTGRTNQTIIGWVRYGYVSVSWWQRKNKPVRLYSWSDIQNHLKVGRKKL